MCFFMNCVVQVLCVFHCAFSFWRISFYKQTPFSFFVFQKASSRKIFRLSFISFDKTRRKKIPSHLKYGIKLSWFSFLFFSFAILFYRFCVCRYLIPILGIPALTFPDLLIQWHFKLPTLKVFRKTRSKKSMSFLVFFQICAKAFKSPVIKPFKILFGAQVGNSWKTSFLVQQKFFEILLIV
jgi:hypothetical protein